MIRALAFAACNAVALLPASAKANPCAPYRVVSQELTETHGQYLTLSMLSPNGILIEIWHDNHSQRWTAISVDPRGTACLLANGQGVMFSVRPNV